VQEIADAQVVRPPLEVRPVQRRSLYRDLPAGLELGPARGIVFAHHEIALDDPLMLDDVEHPAIGAIGVRIQQGIVEPLRPSPLTPSSLSPQFSAP
jgi:hypothetical protein